MNILAYTDNSLFLKAYNQYIGL